MTKKPIDEELGQRNGNSELEAERHKEFERTLHLQAQILSSIKDTIVIITPEMKTIYANQTAKELFGDRSEIFTEPCYRFFKNRDTACENCPVLETIQDEKPHKVVMKSYDKNGQEMWRFNTAFPFYDLDGQVIAGIEIVTDYTPQKNAEIALQKSEERYRELFESMSDGVAIYEAKNEGEDFTFSDFNKAAEKIENFTKDVLIGKSVLEVFPGVKEFGLFDVFKRVWKTGKPEHHPIAMYKDERIVGWRENFVYKLPSGEIVAVYSDVTDRKQAEEALRESEEKYRNLVEESFDGIFVQRGPSIVFANKRLNEMLGYGEGELLGENHWVVYHPDFQKLTRERAQARMSGEEVLPRYEVKLQRKDGSWFYGEINAKPITFPSNQEIGIQVWVKDIDERKRAEEALREAHNIINRSPAVAFLWKIAEGWPVEFVSDNVNELFGYKAEEFTSGKISYAEVVHPDDLERVGEEIKTFRKKEGIENFTHNPYRIVTKDGEIKWLEDMTFMRRDKKGDITHFEGIVLDITERVLAEAALRESEEKLRAVIEHSNELFYIHDTEHALIYATQTSVDLLGYTPEEMMIKWTELATDNPINQKGIENTEKGIATGEKQAPYLLELTKKDGTNVLLEIDESPVKDATGKVVAISGAARDVTEQRRTEQRLLKSEKSFRDLFDSITDLIYTQDLDGRFTSVNRAMCKAFGYEKDAFIGRPASDFMKPEMKPFFESGYLEQIKTKGSHEGITSYFAKNGEKVYIDYRSSLVEPDDGAPYISGTGRDMTEQVLSQREIKRLHNQVHRSQKMEAIGLMAGGVAHDLNNILSGIVSYPELILMDLPENSPLRKPLKTIQESGMRAADVVADLLTVARGIAMGKEVSNLNSQIEEHLNSAEHRQLAAMHPSVTFKTEIDPDLLNISCSPIHIKKTLMNLVANASKAIEGSGIVAISTTNKYLDEPLKGYEDVRTGEYVMLTVSDDGSGIFPGDLERIFEPFYTKKVMGRSGTGLGLAVVWNTVQDHNGYINIKSSEKGTVFELYFPVTRQAVAAEKEAVPLEDYLGHGEKILVVDDEERQREIACGMLTKLGYTAESVSSGEEAIEYLKEKQVDLIVLDMVMPKGINGRETYEEIIKICPGQKAIIASGFSESEEVKMAQKSGAGNYIKKPYILEKIGLAVKEELENIDSF